MGIGNTWHSAAQEVPPVIATLAKKHRSKFKFIAKHRDPFGGELFNKRMKAEAIYSRTWGSCSRIKSL